MWLDVVMFEKYFFLLFDVGELTVNVSDGAFSVGELVIGNGVMCGYSAYNRIVLSYLLLVIFKIIPKSPKSPKSPKLQRIIIFVI